MFWFCGERVAKKIGKTARNSGKTCRSYACLNQKQGVAVAKSLIWSMKMC